MKKIFESLALSPFSHALIVAGSYAALTASLFFKAQLLDAIVQHQGLRHLMILCALFAGLHVLGAGIRMSGANLRHFAKLVFFERSWLRSYPRAIDRSTAKHAEAYFNHTYYTIPSIKDAELSTVVNVTTVVVVLTIYIYKIVVDRFWFALIFIPLLSLLSLLAGSTYANRQAAAIDQVNGGRVKLMQWISFFFRSYRERSLNWVDSNRMHEIHAQQGHAAAYDLKQAALLGYWRSIISMVLIDLPFLGCMVTIFMFAGFGQIGLADVVIWIGLAEYLIEANASLGAARSSFIQSRCLKGQVARDLAWLSKNKPQPVFLPKSAVEATFRLLDGQEVYLCTRPGFYPLLAANGSGKSTLLDTVLDMNDAFKGWDSNVVEEFRRHLVGHARVVEREPILIPNCRDFWQQVFGYPQEASQSLQLLAVNLSQTLPDQLAQSWLSLFAEVAQRWECRLEADLSSGERVILSIARMFSHWNEEVRVVVVDECDAVLDSDNYRLFSDTLKHLAGNLAIYYVSHKKTEKAEDLQSVVATSFVLGHDAQNNAAHVVELKLAGRKNAQGQLHTFGTIGRHLKEDFLIVRRALLHVNPKLAYLESCDFDLDCTKSGYVPGETRSARLAIAAALLNAHIAFSGRTPINGIAATGYVHLDGSIEPVNHLNKKLSAAKNESYVQYILTPEDLNSLGDLILFFKKVLAMQSPTVA